VDEKTGILSLIKKRDRVLVNRGRLVAFFTNSKGLRTVKKARAKEG